MSAGSGAAGAGSDLVAVLRYYVDKMLREVPGMKVLLLDSETTTVVSTVFSQSEILEQEVYLVEKLEADKGDQLLHLKVRSRSLQQVPAAGGGGGWWRVAQAAAVVAVLKCALSRDALRDRTRSVQKPTMAVLALHPLTAGGLFPAPHARQHSTHPA